MKHSIPLELVRLEDNNYHITVNCIFANNTEGTWVIDTGASKTVFDKMLETCYELIPADESVNIQSAGIGSGQLDTSLGILQPFYLGEIEMDAMKVALIDLSNINDLYFHATEKKICGLIGSDFLLERKAVIDYSELLLTLEII